MTDRVEQLAVRRLKLSRHAGVPYRGGLRGCQCDSAQAIYQTDPKQMRCLCKKLSPTQPGALPSASMRWSAVRTA